MSKLTDQLAQGLACGELAISTAHETAHVLAENGMKPLVMVFILRNDPGQPLEVFSGRCAVEGEPFPWEEFKKAVAEMGPELDSEGRG